MSSEPRSNATLAEVVEAVHFAVAIWLGETAWAPCRFDVKLGQRGFELVCRPQSVTFEAFTEPLSVIDPAADAHYLAYKMLQDFAALIPPPRDSRSVSTLDIMGI